VKYLIITISLILFQGCNLLEVNMVQRSTLSNGEKVSSSQNDTTVDEEEDSMRLVVPLK